MSPSSPCTAIPHRRALLISENAGVGDARVAVPNCRCAVSHGAKTALLNTVFLRQRMDLFLPQFVVGQRPSSTHSGHHAVTDEPAFIGQISRSLFRHVEDLV